MQTRLLRTLTRIGQVQSFATAAKQLNMTLSAVSMQMKSLEQELGVELFDRHYRPPKLTPKGRDILEQAKTLLSAEDTLRQTCDPNGELQGRFSIGFVTTTSVRLLPHFLKRAAQFAPKANFELETGLSEYLEEKVTNGQIDAAIVTASGSANPHLHYDVLYKEPFMFAAPKCLKGASVEDLSTTTPFLHFMPNTGIGKLIAEHMNQLRANKPTIELSPIVLDSVEAIMECVKQNIGFTLLPKPDIERYADERVAVFKPTAKSLYRELVLVTARHGHMSSKNEQLKELFEHTET
ncbi:MAG: LysR family transcriptional regulator [Rhizobiaceae bacterium]